MEPPDGTDWVAISHAELPLSEMSNWAARPECGAVVAFAGIARDHSTGRPGVTELEYEGYEEYLVPRLAEVAVAARKRWPDLVCAGLIHRLGVVPLGSAAVVVVASSSHRGSAFEAARYLIDTAKSTVPIWKRETWDGGTDWGLDGCYLHDADEVEVPESLRDRGVDLTMVRTSAHDAAHLPLGGDDGNESEAVDGS